MTTRVAWGQTLRCEKTWKNIGDTGGYKDVIVAYGHGLDPAQFTCDYYNLEHDQYAGPGQQVTTIIDSGIVAGVTPGIRDALVGVGEYDETTKLFHWEVWEAVPDAIEIVPA